MDTEFNFVRTLVTKKTVSRKQCFLNVFLSAQHQIVAGEAFFFTETQYVYSNILLPRQLFPGYAQSIQF